MKSLLSVLTLVLALAAGAALQLYLGRGGGDFEAPAGGVRARADFTLPDLGTGQPRAVSEWDGKRVVLNFWASWCAPCLEEMPMFVELQAAHGARGVQFVGVAIDAPDKARALAQRLKLNYLNLVGEADAMEVARQYGNTNGVLPYTVLINAQGQIEATLGGLVRRDALETWLTKP